MYFKTDKSLRIGIVAIVGLLSLASGVLYLAHPEDAQVRFAETLRSPALPIPPSLEQPKQAPVDDTEIAPETEEASPRMLSPLEALPYQMLMGLDQKEAREDERWVIRNAVKAESVAETIYQLAVTPFSDLFSPALVSLWHNPPSDSSLCYEEMLKDPRVRKLHDIAVSGTPEERAYLFDELLALAEENGGWNSGTAGVLVRMSPHKSMLGALPPLLAEAGEPAESLAALGALARESLAQGENEFDYEARRTEFIATISGPLTSSPIKHAMERALTRAFESGILTSGDGEALASYANQRSEMELFIQENLGRIDPETADRFGIEYFTRIPEDSRTLDDLNRIVEAMAFSGLRTSEPPPRMDIFDGGALILDALMEAAEIRGG